MRNYQEGTTSSLTTVEIIESNIELVKLNGIDNFVNLILVKWQSEEKKKNRRKEKKIYVM